MRFLEFLFKELVRVILVGIVALWGLSLFGILIAADLYNKGHIIIPVLILLVDFGFVIHLIIKEYKKYKKNDLSKSD